MRPDLRVSFALQPSTPVSAPEAGVVVSARFPPAARVRAKVEFDRVFADGRRHAEPLLALHRLDDGLPARLGLAVSRKVDPHAVGRNRIKRVLRDRFRRLRPSLGAGAYVVVARSAARQADNATLREAFQRLLQRAGALPPTPMAGTMPPATTPLPPTAPRPERRPSLPAR